MILEQGAKTPQTSQSKNQDIKQKHYCNKFNKDFLNGLHFREHHWTFHRVLHCGVLNLLNYI